MDKVNLIYKINGVGIEDGVDVFDLSPMLLSFGKLIREAHKTLYPNNREIAVNIKPFQKGSFEINILLFSGAIDYVLDLIRSSQGQEIKELLNYLGLITQPSTFLVSLIALIVALKGRPKSIERLDSGDVRYTSDSGESITVNDKVHNLFQNEQIKQVIYSGIAKPFEIEGVDSIESYIKDDERTKTTFDKNIVKPIKNYSIASIPTLEKEETVENVRQLWVHPKRISLEGEKNSWSFRIAGSDNLITVNNIQDDDFLIKVKTGQYRLANADALFVEILEKQIIRGNNVTSTVDILEVKEYKKAAIHDQSILNFKDDK